MVEKLEGKFTLKDLERFREKATLRLGGGFIPSGEIIQITVPPMLRKYPDVASRYENVTFSRKTATRKKNVDLLGIGHPLIDALLDFYKSESVSGELLNVKCDGVAPNLTARYLLLNLMMASAEKNTIVLCLKGEMVQRILIICSIIISGKQKNLRPLRISKIGLKCLTKTRRPS